MAGIRSCIWGGGGCPLQIPPPINKRVDSFCCCSTSPNGKTKETQTPQLLKVAVVGITELLRLFTPSGPTRTALVDNELKDEISVSSVNDVLSIIRSDYEKAYFVTGFFTSAIYAEDCIFEDPTIKFQGKELYARNLSLLLPFFDNPSIQLKEIDKGLDSETEFLVASWKLRTYLKLPWTPLILIDGMTRYDLDEEFRIVRHVERWNVSAFEAILQIFTPSSVLDNMRRVCNINNLKCRVMGLTWGVWDAPIFDLHPNIILGADVLYDTSAFDILFATVTFLLEKCPDSVFITTYHNRSGHHLIDFLMDKWCLKCTKLLDGFSFMPSHKTSKLSGNIQLAEIILDPEKSRSQT